MFWFHAFRSGTMEEAFRVLHEGPAPPPASVKPDTRELESLLSIAEPRVYCYLGRTSDSFGPFAVAVSRSLDDAPGDVSPFDTGGLVKKIAPVHGWPEADKRLYLKGYTWSASELDELLRIYPSTSRDRGMAYLEATAPT